MGRRNRQHTVKITKYVNGKLTHEEIVCGSLAEAHVIMQNYGQHDIHIFDQLDTLVHSEYNLSHPDEDNMPDVIEIIEEPIVEEKVEVIEEPIVEETITETPIAEETIVEESIVEETITETPIVEEAKQVKKTAIKKTATKKATSK